MKKALSLIMAAVMTASLAACGGSGSSTSTTAAAGSAGSEAAGSTAAAAKSGSGETVKIICPYGVGGTADIIARKYAEVATSLHPEYNYIVEQQTGGDGFAAATAYTQEDASTTDLLVYGYGVAYRHDLGKKYNTEVVDWDRSEIQPLASIDDRTWIVYTTPDKSLSDILDKAKNGGIKMSGGNPLSDPHLALGSLIAQEGGKLQVVPYDGGAAQKKGLTDGEVDVFVGTTQAAQEDVEAGNVVPILAFSDKAFEGFKDKDGNAITVPSVAGDAKAPELDASKDYSGSILSAGGFIATRTGAPEDWVDAQIQVAKDVWASSDYSDFIASILLNKYEVYGDEAAAHLEEACTKAVAAYETLSGQSK
jgi:tripartite-type tricarboxylate transporter receptor subunit TctC